MSFPIPGVSVCLGSQRKRTTIRPHQRPRPMMSVTSLTWIITCISLVFAWYLGKNYHSTVVLYTSEESKTTHERLRLRLDWNNLEPASELARQMMAHQKNCSAPMGTFRYRNRFGLGSDLHLWGQALCNGMQIGLRLRTVGTWIWMDEHQCRHKESPMLCYFGSSELNCPSDVEEAKKHPTFDLNRSLSRPNGYVVDSCQPIYRGMSRSQVRVSAMEFLFLHVDSILIQEAQRQLNLVFQGLNEVPKDLITVHIRWGDKGDEMKLVGIDKYISAIRQILEQRRASGTTDTEIANIYLATEDPEAVRQFREAMPNEWNLYLEHGYTELLPHRIAEYNGSPKMSKVLHGRAGLITLGSLLVAMEANDFVLTTGSNWSRVMNELRKAILDPRCGNCTSMIDLQEVRNEW